MTTKFISLMMIILILGLFACGVNNNENDTDGLAANATGNINENSPKMNVVKSADEKPFKNEIVTLTGQLLYQKMEGGFFGFVANNGDKYTPSGLTDEYRKNGLIVELKVELLPKLITTTQFGTSVKILEIKVLDTSNVSDTHKSM